MKRGPGNPERVPEVLSAVTRIYTASIAIYICTEKSQAITYGPEHLLDLTYEEYKLHKAGVTGVAVPEAGCDAGDGPGDGTSPNGSLRYAFRKFRQFALEGTKCPASAICTLRECKNMVKCVPPSCHSIRPFAEMSVSVFERSSTTITSVRPRTWRVGVENDGRKIESHSGLVGLNPAAAMQNVLKSSACQRARMQPIGVPYKGGCGGFPSTRNGGKTSGFSSYDDKPSNYQSQQLSRLDSGYLLMRS